MATEDDGLLAACRRGDRDAWKDLVEQYHRLVRSIARSYGLRDGDVDDVVQLVFSILVKQLDRFREDTRLAPWLSTVTRRHVWRLLEQRRRERPAADPALVDGSHRAVDDHADRMADAEWVREGLAHLPARCQRLLAALYRSPDRPYADVAAELGLPIGSIGPTRARCLEQLRRTLDELRSTEVLNHD